MSRLKTATFKDLTQNSNIFTVFFLAPKLGRFDVDVHSTSMEMEVGACTCGLGDCHSLTGMTGEFVTFL